MEWLRGQEGLLYFLTLTSLAVSTTCTLPCLTWEIKNDVLSLICQLKDFSSTVFFKDPKGKTRGFCDFHSNCSNIDSDVRRTTVTLKLETKDIEGIEGKWSCVQGNKTFTRDVSRNKDTRKLSYLQINGTVISRNTSKILIEVTCTTCIRPTYNEMEYLINGTTEDTIFFYPNSKKCNHQHGPCTEEKCSCLLEGHKYSRLFDMDSIDSTLSISCLTTLKDGNRSFHRNSTLQFDGNNFSFVDSNDQPFERTSHSHKTNAVDVTDTFELIGKAAPLSMAFMFLILTAIKIDNGIYRFHEKRSRFIIFCLTCMCTVGTAITTPYITAKPGHTISQIIYLIMVLLTHFAIFKTDTKENICGVIVTTIVVIYYPVDHYIEFKYTGVIAIVSMFITFAFMAVGRIVMKGCGCTFQAKDMNSATGEDTEKLTDSAM